MLCHSKINRHITFKYALRAGSVWRFGLPEIDELSVMARVEVEIRILNMFFEREPVEYFEVSK